MDSCPEAFLTFPSDAADLVRTIFKAVKYIHDSGVVHRGSHYLPSVYRHFNHQHLIF